MFEERAASLSTPVRKIKILKQVQDDGMSTLSATEENSVALNLLQHLTSSVTSARTAFQHRQAPASPKLVGRGCTARCAA